MNYRIRKTLQAAAGAVALAMLLLAGVAAADDAAGQVWLISTRRAPRSGRVESARGRIDYWRFRAQGEWLPADEDAFLQGDEKAAPTAIFIHGNRVDPDTAIRDGWRVYRCMKRHAAGRPFRLAIWSWPADRVPGRNRYDVQVKACRSDVQSYYLAECLQRLDPEVPVSLIGYSFGARVITGALHILAGGQVAGRSLPEPTGERRQIRAVLVAAALDADWLLPGRRNGLTLSQVDRMLVTRNARDPVLRWYRLTYGRGGPPAMGHVGPAWCGPAGNLEVLDVTCSVGRAHRWAWYMADCGLRRRLGQYTFVESPESE